MAIEAVFKIKIAGIKLGDIIPRFQDCDYKNNLLSIICSDEKSRALLIEAVGGLKLWKGAMIIAIDSKVLTKAGQVYGLNTRYFQRTVIDPKEIDSPETRIKNRGSSV